MDGLGISIVSHPIFLTPLKALNRFWPCGVLNLENIREDSLKRGNFRDIVEPWFYEVPRDRGNCSLYRGSLISRFFSIHYAITGLRISFLITRTSLYRGSLNRSSTVHELLLHLHERPPTHLHVYEILSSQWTFRLQKNLPIWKVTGSITSIWMVVL